MVQIIQSYLLYLTGTLQILQQIQEDVYNSDNSLFTKKTYNIKHQSILCLLIWSNNLFIHNNFNQVYNLYLQSIHVNNYHIQD